MKFSAIFLLLACALFGEDPEKSYQLAEKDWEGAVGTRIQMKTSRVILNGKIKYINNGAWTTGKVSSLEENEIIGERKSEDSYLLRFVREVSRYRLHYQGRKSNERNETPFHEKTIRVDREDGEWVAKIVEGDADDVNPDELEKRFKGLTKNIQFDYAQSLYGTKPRKVGETWEVESPNIPGMSNGKVVSGKATVTFEEVKELRGHQCAVLKVEFDVKMDFSEIDGGRLEFVGEGEVVRSLEAFLDFDLKTKGKLKALNGSEEDGVETEGKCTVSSEILILPPVEKE